MQLQRLDPQPCVYHALGDMYHTGDGIHLRVLASMGLRPVLAPEQVAPWPDAELWHDSDGEWYWRRWPPGMRPVTDDILPGKHGCFIYDDGLSFVSFTEAPHPLLRGSIDYNPAGSTTRYSIPDPSHIFRKI